MCIGILKNRWWVCVCVTLILILNSNKYTHSLQYSLYVGIAEAITTFVYLRAISIADAYCTITRSQITERHTMLDELTLLKCKLLNNGKGFWATVSWLAANFPNFQEMINNYLIMLQYRIFVFHFYSVHSVGFILYYRIESGGLISCGIILHT